MHALLQKKKMPNRIITILILSFSIWVCYGTSYAHKTKPFTTEVHEKFLSEALQVLKGDIGRYPTEDEGLELLLEPHVGLEAKWDGPYLKHRILNDEWGNKYIYHYPARYSGKDFDLYSRGENAQDDRGEKDDITNWKEGGSQLAPPVVSYPAW